MEFVTSNRSPPRHHHGPSLIDWQLNKLVASWTKIVSGESKAKPKTVAPKLDLTIAVQNIRRAFREVDVGIQRICNIPFNIPIVEAEQFGTGWLRLYKVMLSERRL